MPFPLKPFQMLRHGQTTANAQDKLSGITDVDLSEQGIAESTAAKEALAKHDNKPSIIVHSKLSRAKHTAEIVNEALGLEMVEHPHIHEQNFGDWENKGIGIYIESYNTRKNPTNGETFDEFESRVIGAITDILNTYENPLIVCHGGIFRSFYALYKQGHLMVGNAEAYSFVPNKENEEFPWDIKPIR